MSVTFYLVQTLFLIIINISAVVIGLLVLKSNIKDGLNRWFFLMSIFMVLWVNFAFLGSTITDNIFLSLNLYRLNSAVVAFSLFIFYYFFSAYFLRQKGEHRILDTAILLASIVIGLLSISTNLIIESVTRRNWGMEIVFGPLSLALNIFAIAVSGIVLYLGYKHYISSPNKERRRTVHFFIGILIFIVANIIFNILAPLLLNTSEYQHLGDFSVIFFLAFTAYAIMRQRLFDVRLAVVRSVTYTLVLIVLAGVYLAITTLFSTIFSNGPTSSKQIVSGVATGLLLVFLFQPIKRLFDKITNRLFYKDNYNSEDFFARLNRTLTFTTDLRSLLERAANEISHTLKSEQAFFFINTDDDHHITAGTLHHRQFPKDDIAQLRTAHNLDYEVIVASLRKDNDQIRRLMLSHRIELILPLVQDDEIIGYLCLGDHLTSGYTNRDIKVLSTISDGLIIAIKNALAVQEIRELNSNLQQRINNAIKELRTSNMALRRLDKAKDEFVSMASHQLRTPLTSVKGYISMVLEGDVGKISDSQRQLLNEAFVGSERMTRLINDFLNVSRIQTGKFMIDKHPFNLSKLIEQEIDSLQPSAKVHNLKFNYNPPKDIPAVEVDESKIRQVVMNFIDNAIYYSHDGGVVAINLLVEGSNVTFTVKDDGIGIPHSEQAQLFTKFYRATNAKKQRPDGTGVGLYLAKKIINAHDGKMIFESTQDNGSTFGFRLPIK